MYLKSVFLTLRAYENTFSMQVKVFVDNCKVLEAFLTFIKENAVLILYKSDLGLESKQVTEINSQANSLKFQMVLLQMCTSTHLGKLYRGVTELNRL